MEERIIRGVAELGNAVREARRGAALDQETAAALSGVGTRFLGDLERGKETVRLGLVLRVLDRFGFEVVLRRRR